MSSPESLAHYDATRTTVISSDASNAGLGAVIAQLQDDGAYKPVAYASRSLTDAEKNYAVIEKEALAVTWACEKFTDYVLGMKFTVHTDHKPLGFNRLYLCLHRQIYQRCHLESSGSG